MWNVKGANRKDTIWRKIENRGWSQTGRNSVDAKKGRRGK